MKRRIKMMGVLLPMLILFFNSFFTAAQPNQDLLLENNRIRVKVDPRTGAVSSFFIKDIGCEMIGEPALISNFRILLPLDDYQANYIDGMKQNPKNVIKEGNSIVMEFSGMSSEKGSFPIDLKITISLYSDFVSFKARLTNHFQ